MLISVTDRQTQRHGQTSRTDKSRFCHLQPSDMDFSENYTCVAQDEIQSAHWNKISVFIVVCWVSGQTESYALISDYREHDKYFCGHFNQTIIADLKRKCSLHTIDFFTDDAASQFKHKCTLNNMTLLFNEKDGTCHFFSTSHGKGAVDRIGGEVKRKASILAFSGRTQIQNAEQFVTALRIYSSHQPILTPKTALQNVEKFDKKVWIINSPPTRVQKNSIS